MSLLELRFFDGGGNPSYVAPAASSLQFTASVSDQGTVEYDYPASGTNASYATTPLQEGAVYLDGIELRNSRFLVKQKADPGIDDSGRVIKVNAPTLVSRLERAIVYPPNGAGTQPTEQTFSSKNPGYVMLTLINQAKARGALSWLDTTTFSNTLDSKGASWANNVSIAFDQGTSVLAVLRKLVEMGVVEFEMRGRQLWLANPGTMGTDRSTGATPVTLSLGRDLDDGPRNTDTDPISVMLVMGDNGVGSEQVNATTVATYGRLEAPLNMTGISDAGTLAAAGQIALLASNHPKYEVSHGLRCTPTSVIATARNPYTDYWLFDKILVDDAINAVTAYTVKQIVLRNTDEGLRGEIRMNDLIEDQDVATDLALSRLTGGSSNSSPGPGTPDLLAPAAPGAPTVSSSTYVAADGQIQTQVTISWVAVTTNSDGSVLSDLGGYEVQAAVSGSNWIPLGTVDGTVLYSSPYPPGTNISVRLRAFDTSDNKGAWSSTTSITTSSDTTAPPTPSTPTLTTPFLESVRISWDGLGSVGQAMPADFARLEVHMSTTSGFTPSSSTQVDEFDTIGGITTIQGTPGVAQFVKLIAVDRSGNKSAASAQATATPTKAVTSEIGTLQVTDALIANASISKLTAGTLSADMIVGARIKTADTGARVELNSAGLKAYNSSNVLTVSINSSDGSATFTGTITGSSITGSTITGGIIQTATSGQRIVIDGTNADRIKFYTGSGSETANGALQVLGAGDLYLFPPKLTSSGNQTPLIDMINLGPGSAFTEIWGEALYVNVFGTLELNGPTAINVKDLMTFDDGSYSSGKPWTRWNASVFNDYYTVYADNTGTSGTSRWWLDTPNGGEVHIGPRAGANTLAWFRMRADHISWTLTDTTASAANVNYNSSTFVISRFTSSLKYKEDVRYLPEPDWRVLDLVPFLYKSNGSADTNNGTEPSRDFIGLAAEDADEFGLFELVGYDETTGEPDWLMYDRVAAMMLPMIRNLKQRVEALEAV